MITKQKQNKQTKKQLENHQKKSDMKLQFTKESLRS